MKCAVERDLMMRLVAPKWAADIRNNGKLLAIFDFAQQERNKKFKFNTNKKEIMYIQNIRGEKGS